MIRLRRFAPLAALSLLAACSAGEPAPDRAAGGEVGATSTTGSPAATPPGCPATDRARLEPVDGAYFGVSIDWSHDGAAAYAERLGRKPAVYVEFAPFPIDENAGRALDAAVASIREQGAMLLLTLEPHAGLGSVTAATAEDLGRRVAGYNAGGVPVFVRFAHEMNGSWYPWSQQPSAYVVAFRTVADAVHRLASGSAMLWAPNYGGGYPFAGGPHEAKPDAPDFAALDTDHNKRLTMADDPYAPYWPGDDAVDWVGLSLYHWGSAYPWGENEDPEAGKFVALLTGNYHGFNGDETAVPDFYTVYGDGHGKPVAIMETAALFVPGQGGAAEDTIKRNWWHQVLDPALAERFPRLRMINWFEWDKHEGEIGARVDWTVTRAPTVLTGFRAALRPDFRFAGADRCRPV